jgi:hypothetical protein
MAATRKSKLKKREFSYLEKWDTRFGKSERVVIRNGYGHFVDNVSLTALKRAAKASR